MQAPLPYMYVPPPVDAWEVDRGHLRTLAICHSVAGGLEIAFSSIFIIHVVLGVIFLTNPGAMAPPPPPAGRGGMAGMPQRPAPQAPPPAFGWMFIGMGSCAVTAGWTTGILTIVSGRAIARRRWRTFSLVMAGVNCLWVPIGTVLGVFSFIVLMRGSVAALYAHERAPDGAAAAGAAPAAAAGG
jgi:hypothetical protein